MVDYRAQFRGTPGSVRFAREAVVDYARLCGFSSSEIADIALAAGEALANAVEHGNKDLGYIDVHCAFAERTLVVEIGDAGSGFDIDVVTSRPREPGSIRGFGISIMHAVMDDVRYLRQGAVVRLVKRAPGASVGAERARERA